MVFGPVSFRRRGRAPGCVQGVTHDGVTHDALLGEADMFDKLPDRVQTGRTVGAPFGPQSGEGGREPDMRLTSSEQFGEGLTKGVSGHGFSGGRA